MIHALDVDHRFRLPDFAFLQLSWPFLYFAFTDDVQGLGPPGDYWYDLGPTMIAENASGTLRTKLRESLEELGFSFDTRDSHGRTYLHFVAQSGPLKYDGLHFLLQRGANVSATDRDGCTPLHYAAKEGQADNVSILLDAGAVATAADYKGSTVLHCAVGNGNESIVQMLLDAGAAPTAVDHDGWTVLHEAASQQ
jgi:ankyrin repeat protein